MKKLSLLALPLALLALGSCNDNEMQGNQQKTAELSVVPVSNLKINRGYTQNNKFYETYTSELHSTEADSHSRMMYISGYLTQQTGKQMTYFQGATFKEYDGTWHNYLDGNFDPIFWPLGGTMDFLAFSLSGEEGTPKPQNVEWAANPSEQVTLSLPAGCSQNDILYAGAYDVNAQKETGNFNMEFSHAQAWIEFVLTGSAKNVNGDEVENGINIKSIELENIYNTGKLIISKDGTKAKAKAEWNFCNGFSQKNIPMDGCGSLESLSDKPQYLDMLIPEQNQTKILLKYTYKNDPLVLEYEFDLVESNLLWEMGKKYVYAININANEITVTPTVKLWDEVDAFSATVKYHSTVKDADEKVLGTVAAEMTEPSYASLYSGTEDDGFTVDTCKVWGAQVKLTATPSTDDYDNVEFKQWSDGVKKVTREFNITEDFVAPEPEFVRYYCFANVKANNTERGSVEFPTENVYVGDEVTLKAVPASGFKFSKWTDGVSVTYSDDSEYTFTVDTDNVSKKYVAVFISE